MSAVDRVLQEALELPTEDRAQIAASLLASIDGPDDDDADDLWAREIERRAQRAQAGESQGVDWKDVKRRVRERLDHRR